MNDRVVVPFPGPLSSRNAEDLRLSVDAAHAHLTGAHWLPPRDAIMPAGELHARELAVLAWAARLSEGISTICVRAADAPTSLAEAYDRFKTIAHLADLTGSIARYSQNDGLSVESREAFLEVAVEDLQRLAARYWAELPVGWCSMKLPDAGGIVR